MTAPDRHAVANALLAAQCPAGVCARDVDQLDRALRGRLLLQADNLIRNPFGLLDALGIDARANRAEIKLLVSEQDVEHWAAYAVSLEGIVRKLRTLEPGPRGRELSWTADEMETLRQVTP